MARLEARRRTLLAQCAAQRDDLAARLSELKQEPLRRAQAAVAGAGTAGATFAGRHPLWIAALAALTVLGRTREVLTLLVWARTALSVATRAAQLLRLIGSLRTRRASSRTP